MDAGWVIAQAFVIALMGYSTKRAVEDYKIDRSPLSLFILVFMGPSVLYLAIELLSMRDLPATRVEL